MQRDEPSRSRVKDSTSPKSSSSFNLLPGRLNAGRILTEPSLRILPFSLTTWDGV